LNHSGFLLSLFYFAFSATRKQARRKFFVRFYEWQTKRKSTEQPKKLTHKNKADFNLKLKSTLLFLQILRVNFCR